MLDVDTKRRIDTARDILVGKVPDPKSQVEQITIALIYKFMDDLDAESEELGGERNFFSGDFARYGWAKLLHPSLGGYETLSLYAEAITRMPENPGIPLLFRDIFNNAYLPYRDPETLRAFLKVIDEFTYDHSERLGDAFEYLLSVLGAQGDAGQFRTPRHIIDFIVSVVDPKKDDTVLDPACGTAGFLISAYKHILAANTESSGQGTLTPDERGRLVDNFQGYDISPDMVRLSLVNMYLHGFRQPHIHEYDTLTSEERWNEYADVFLANPPFMSPRGGIRPHNRFSVKSKRSEVLFVDYMAEHLTPGGRAGIIIPEGIIFQSQTAYKQLRQMLVGNYLVAVVSLPVGVFNPYSGVKTSILILDQTLAKSSSTVAFFRVENDGYDLGAQRRPIDRNDLPQVKKELKEYLRRLRASESLDDFQPNSGLVATKKDIASDGEFNLSGERYRENKYLGSRTWPMVRLQDVCKTILSGGTPSTKQEEYWTGDIPWITSADILDIKTAEPRRFITHEAIENSATNLIPKGNVIVVTRVGLGKLFTNSFDVCISQDSQGLILKDGINANYLAYVLKPRVEEFNYVSQGSTIQGVTKKQLAEIPFPLPPVELQQEIVGEIEGYQKIIAGAQAVVESYQPKIEVDQKWPMVALGGVCQVVRGSSPRPKGSSDYYGGAIPRLMVADITRDGMYSTPKLDSLTEVGAAKSRPMKKGDVIITVSGNPGLPTILAVDACIHDGFVGLRNLDGNINPEYLYWNLLSQHDAHGSQSVGAIFKNLTTQQVKNFAIPLPSKETQEAIVAGLAAESRLVRGTQELIKIFEGKIQATVAGVWDDESAMAPDV